MAFLFWALSKNRTFRELLALGEGECRALVDVVLNAAHLVNMPSNSVAAIQAMKPTERKS